MNKLFFKTKLEKKFILSLTVSLVISVLFSIFIQTLSEYALNRYYNNSSFLQKKNQEALSDFNSFVEKNNISIKDHKEIEKWVRKYKYIDIYIFKNDNLIYNSTRNNLDTDSESIIYISDISSSFENVTFKDDSAKVYMDCYFQYKYYYVTIIFSVFIGFICFLIVMLKLINKKISYIGNLENEIKILEGGDLNYNITIEGNDELSYLAESINEMRKSFIERLENEDEAKSANSELITAMSHDLRTPLTALLGYLDIIRLKKYKTEEELMQYILNSHDKAYQIKTLSDKLFEYFLVFNRNEDLDFETLNGNELLEQLLEEEFFMLSNENFNFDYIPCNKIFTLKINLISIRRVFDNVFSNILKYADKKEPITIRCFVENNELNVIVKNLINRDRNKLNSTGIGLKSCKKIIQKHKGNLNTEMKDNHFIVTISLNIIAEAK